MCLYLMQLKINAIINVLHRLTLHVEDTDMQEFKGFKEESIMDSIQLHDKIHKLRISISLILGIGPFSILTHIFPV